MRWDRDHDHLLRRSSPPASAPSRSSSGGGSAVSRLTKEKLHGRGARPYRTRRRLQDLRRLFQRRRRRQPQDSRWRLLLPARPVRLRQDHDSAHDSRTRGSDRGRNSHRRRERRRPAAGRAPHRDDVPVLCAVPAPVGARQHRVRAAGARDFEGGAAPRRRRHDGKGQTDRVRRPAAGATVGRPAAARRTGARRHHRNRGCCCSTNRCQRSTSFCAFRCARSCATCSANSASRSCTSRTPSSRRSRSRTSWS